MTTPKMNMSLSEIFDVELTKTDKSIDALKIDAKAESIDTLEVQRKYVKDNIVKLIEKGQTAIDNMHTIANSTEDGKDFAVLTNMIKTIVEANMTLLDCEVAHRPKSENDSENSKVTNTAVFVGSTTELAKFIKNSSIDV